MRKLVIGVAAAAALLGGCASDPYYAGRYYYDATPAYGTTYYYDYGSPYPYYTYPGVGGGVYFNYYDDDRRGRRWADRDHDGDRSRDRDRDGRGRDNDGRGRDNDGRGRDRRHDDRRTDGRQPPSDFGGRGHPGVMNENAIPPGQRPEAQGR